MQTAWKPRTCPSLLTRRHSDICKDRLFGLREVAVNVSQVQQSSEQENTAFSPAGALSHFITAADHMSAQARGSHVI